MASLSVENLTKKFDDVLAVDNLSLKIDDGEFLVIVGPSGCGKSTTLNCIAGLEKPTSGRIRIGDTDVTDHRPQERDIAMVFQNYALYPHYNVRRNIAFGLNMTTDLNDAEINEQVEEIAELLDISELLDQQPRELSGGQQQRVALGRAIVRNPQVFLMDEPLSNLDAKLRSTMRTEIQQLQNNLEIMTVYVTHDQVEAMTMGDQIAIMNDGELQQVGTPLEVYYQPANQFVAGFIGSPSMNFFSVRKRVKDGQVTLEHDLFNYTLRDPSPTVRDAADDLVLGIRPDAFTEVDTGSANTIEIEIEIDVVEPMGDENLAYFSYEGSTYTISLPPERLPEEGSSIRLTSPKDRIHLFDADTGESIREATIITESVPYDESGQPA
jgi:multiple sugar transport system ATP-binding protein